MKKILYHYFRESDYTHYNINKMKGFINTNDSFLLNTINKLNNLKFDEIKCVIAKIDNFIFRKLNNNIGYKFKVNDKFRDFFEYSNHNPNFSRRETSFTEYNFIKKITDVFNNDMKDKGVITFIEIPFESDLQFNDDVLKLIHKDKKTNEVFILYSYAGDNPGDVKSINYKNNKYIIDDINLEISNIDSELLKQDVFGVNFFNNYMNSVFINLKSPSSNADFMEIRTLDLKMSSVIEYAEHLAGFENPIFIFGESGTGKELFAKAIYSSSKRAKNEFHAVNTAAISDELFSAEMFGTTKGAFTGAVDRAGLFEIGDGSTIFLDEIGDLSLYNQAKLLRILQEKTFTRLGSNDLIKSDFRLICATNKNLEQLIKDGKFREDLYYRIKTFTINLPALRERGKSDIKLLLEYFLGKIAGVLTNIQFSDSAIEILCDYKWPGNIRELEHFVINAFARATLRVKRKEKFTEAFNYNLMKEDNIFYIDDEIVLQSLNLKQETDFISSIDSENKTSQELENIKTAEKNDHNNIKYNDLNLEEKLEIIEKNEILKALNKSKTQKEAAKMLGYTTQKMSRQVKKYNLKK